MALIYEVGKQVLGFKEGKSAVYKVAAVCQQKVGFAKLVFFCLKKRCIVCFL